MGKISKKVQEGIVKWYTCAMKRRGLCRKEGDTNGSNMREGREEDQRRWLNSVRDDIRDYGLSMEEVY